MKDAVLILLCAVALAQGINENPNQQTRACNCDPTEAEQICQANYDNEHVLIAHEYCDKFYKCANGRPVAYYCPNNLLYDPYTESCNWSYNVDCGDRPISEGPGQEEDGDSDNDDVSDVENDWTCNCNPSEAPSICAAEGSNGIFVAHENCNQFYRCAEGIPVTFDCAPPLLYNPYKESCDWPQNVECGDRVILEPEEDDNNDDDNTTESDSTCNCNPEEAPAICAAPDSDGVLIAHENCNQYYICNHGVPSTVSCSGDLLFNPYTKQCDWPRNVDCGDRLVPETECTGCNDNTSNDASCDDDNASPPAEGDNSPPSGNDSKPEDSNSSEIQPPGDDVVITPQPPGTCNCNPEEAPSICAAGDSDGVLVAHENCNQFYKCEHGKPVVFTCHGDLLYNPYTEQCDWPENVDCGDRVIPEADDSVTNPGATNPDSTTPGGSIPGNNCDPSEAPAICAADESDGILIAHENCNQFYMCADGKPVTLTCPPNLLFNPAKDQCDWPYNVDCGDRVIPDPEDPEDPASDSSEIQPPGDDVVAPPQPPGTCNCNPEEAPSICAAGDSDGVLVAHENCNQFYKCEHGKPVVFTCHGDLLYNPYTEQCDWPENVDCGDRVIPEADDSVTNPGATNPDSTTPGGSIPGNNCDPSEAPAICAADESDGILIAHENCNQFYMCADGKPVALTCPPNLLFNPAKDQCDWPYNVDCGDRVIPDPEDPKDPASDSSEIQPPGDDVVVPPQPPGTCNCNPEEAPSICAAGDSDGVLVAHENCNQFYKCEHGKPVVFTCHGDLLYNPYTEQCDWPENVDCGDRVIPEADDSVTNPGATNPDSTTPGGSIPGNNCDPSEAPAICAADESDGILIAHENCNQFYMCADGKPVTLTCPPNLLFNPAKDQCDWPYNVDCGDRVIPDPEDPKDPASDSSEIQPPGDDVVVPPQPPGTCNCNPEEAPSICAAGDSDGVLVAHENCNQFYKCEHGKPVVFTCHGDLLYNPYTEQCDWPENVDCGDRVIPEADDSVTNPGATNPDSTTPGGSIPGNNCDPSEAPAICAADESDGILIAHENCNQFYMCADGKPVTLTCPPNLLFNPAKDQCDWPYNVDCGDRVIPDPEDPKDPASDSSEIQPPGDDVVVPPQPPGTCNCNPEEAPSICAAGDSDGVLVAHENCNQFYKCEHGKPVVFTCHGDLLYNPYTEQCDWPENVDCGDRVIPEADDSVTNPGATNPDSTTSGGSIPGNNCDPSEAPAICAADESDGILIAHENCNQFYMCADGKPVALTCPPNLLFNPAKDQCDWPYNVDCGDRVIPDPEDPEDPASDSSEIQPPGDDVVVPTQPPVVESNETTDCSENNDENTCNCDPDQAPSICAVGNSDGVMIAHENCNQFYKCDNGRPVPFKCPANTMYNPITQVCDWTSNVECSDRIIPDPEDNVSESTEEVESDEKVTVGPCNCNPEEAPAICAINGSSGVQIAHENCNQFYVCNHGLPVAFTCNGFLLYNPYTQNCDWPEKVECGDRVIPEPESDNEESDSDPEDNNNNIVNDDPSQAPTICASYGSEGLLVAHENCDQYYICIGGVPVSRPCSGGLLFNPYNQYCDWPRNVDCGDRIVPGGDDCACNPRNAPALCAKSGSLGKLIAHENCNQFYICSNSFPVAQSCPASLLYNIDSELCDWPQNVNCDNRMLPSASLNKHWPSRQTLRN